MLGLGPRADFRWTFLAGCLIISISSILDLLKGMFLAGHDFAAILA